MQQGNSLPDGHPDEFDELLASLDKQGLLALARMLNGGDSSDVLGPGGLFGGPFGRRGGVPDILNWLSNENTAGEPTDESTGED